MSNQKNNNKVVFHSNKNSNKPDMLSNSINYKVANSTMFNTSTKERFCYHDDEKNYKTLIKITNVVPYDKESGKIIESYNKNSSLGPRLLSCGSQNQEHRRYKKNKAHNLEKYRSISTSNVEKLSSKINKYIEHDLNTDEYYSALIKNNIDPEAKQVNKIFGELELQGSTGVNQTVNKLVKIKNCSRQYDILEKKIVANPLNQTMTSYDQFYKLKRNKSGNLSFDSTLNSNKKFNKLKSSNYYNNVKKQLADNVSQSGGDVNNKIIDSCEDNLALGNLKRRFNNSIITKHHNDSEDVISHTRNPKTIKSITVENVNNNIDNHKSKKINFMTSSTAFKIDKEPIDKNSLLKKHHKSIIQNYSSKDSLSFVNTKNPKVMKEMQIYIDKENKGKPRKDKNIISEENILGCSKEKKKEMINRIKGGENDKIVGMYGKGKTPFTNSSQIDQRQSDYKSLFEWKVEKCKHDVSKNAINNTHDKSLYNPCNDYNKSKFSNGLTNGKKVETDNNHKSVIVNHKISNSLNNTVGGENFADQSSRTQKCSKGFESMRTRKL